MIGSPLSLDFHIFETVSLFLTILVVALVLQDGQSHWLQGFMLLMAYVVMAVAFVEHKDDRESSANDDDDVA